MAAPAIVPYKAAIFFDNDETQIRSVERYCNKQITLVKIPESTTGFIRFDTSPLSDYILGFEGNRYLEFARTYLGLPDDHYDPLSGIQESHMDTARTWLETTSAVPRAAFFDWDRTISVFEGFLDLSHPKSKPFVEAVGFDLVLTDMITYICGGIERRDALRLFFNELVSAGVDLYVLTNNKVCGSDFYTQVVKNLFGEIPVKIICGKMFGFEKGFALTKTPRMEQICEDVFLFGGYRRRSKNLTRRRRGAAARRQTWKSRTLGRRGARRAARSNRR